MEHPLCVPHTGHLTMHVGSCGELESMKGNTNQDTRRLCAANLCAAVGKESGGPQLFASCS